MFSIPFYHWSQGMVGLIVTHFYSLISSVSHLLKSEFFCLVLCLFVCPAALFISWCCLTFDHLPAGNSGSWLCGGHEVGSSWSHGSTVGVCWNSVSCCRPSPEDTFWWLGGRIWPVAGLWESRHVSCWLVPPCWTQTRRTQSSINQSVCSSW